MEAEPPVHDKLHQNELDMLKESHECNNEVSVSLKKDRNFEITESVAVKGNIRAIEEMYADHERNFGTSQRI